MASRDNRVVDTDPSASTCQALRKRAEEKDGNGVRHQQSLKMESACRQAGGVALDSNNIPGIIRDHAETANPFHF